jgi:hypothetical protein
LAHIGDRLSALVSHSPKVLSEIVEGQLISHFDLERK